VDWQSVIRPLRISQSGVLHLRSIRARCFASRASQICLRHLRQNNPTGKSAKPVQTSAQKYSAFAVGQITDLNPRVSPDERGVAHVTNARWDAVDAALAHDERKLLADGEVVWSWRPTLAPSSWEASFSGMTVAKELDSPGRARSKP